MHVLIKGVTLIELVIALVVVSILLAIGVPSYVALRENQMLTDVAQSLYSDVQYARSEAIKRNSAVAVRFFSGSNWCYRVTDQPAGTCNSCSATCDLGGDGISRGHGASDYPATTITINYGSDVLDITPRRGLTSTGSVDFSHVGKDIRVGTSRLGRVQICVPTGSESILGVSAC